MVHRQGMAGERVGPGSTPFSGWSLASVLVVTLLAAVGCLVQQREPSLEEKAQEIDRSLMCPVCPSETVDQSQVELAKQMRAIVREKLAAGESRQEILGFFVARFGERVLAAPPKQGSNLVAWIIPGVGLLAGGAALLLALRYLLKPAKGETASHPSPEPAREEMEPYLSRVDEEMRRFVDGLHLPADQPGEDK